MESQHPQQPPPPNSDHKDDDVSPFTGKIGTRWTPTADHVRILKDLYYVSGVRSPTADQIQRITHRLRQYGKIEAKNVFYWFQNHKARERNKRRFTLSHVPLPPPTPHKQKGPSRGVGKHQNNCAAGGADTTPHGMLGFGQIDTSGGSYSSVLPMESSFSGCPISAAPGQGIFGGWVGINPYTSSYTVFENQLFSVDESSSEGCTPEKETLPLFPMSGGNDIYKLNSDRHNGSDTNSLTSSLDLSLCPRHREEIAPSCRAD